MCRARSRASDDAGEIMTAIQGSDTDGAYVRFTGNEAEMIDGPIQTVTDGIRKRLR